jgi:hypothetical protein
MVIPFTTTDWNALPETRHPGETGFALWKTLQFPGLRIRLVEYSANYLADHWCEKGHILFCLSGKMVTELRTGEHVTLTKNMSYQVSDTSSSHRTSTQNGAKLFIVDGDFLRQ